MAVGDKLVTLDGLKAVYQDVNGNVNDLKSAVSNLESQTDTVFNTKKITNAIVASFDDGIENAPVKSFIIDINPVQDTSGGAPSPDNICPISALTEPTILVAGKNIFDGVFSGGTANGLTWTVSDDGKVTVNGTASDTTLIESTYGSYQWDGSSQIWMSGCPAGGNASDAYALRVSTDNSSNYSKYDIGNGILLQPSGTSTKITNTGLKFTIVIRSGYQCNNLVFSPMLSAGNIGTEYEKFNGRTYEFDYPDGAGTVYGAILTLDDNNEWQLIVDRAYVQIDNTASWEMYESGKFYVGGVTVGAKTGSNLSKYICNKYVFEGSGASSSSNITIDKRFYGQSSFGRIWVYDSSYTTLDAFKSSLSSTPLQIVYPINTPVTYTIADAEIVKTLGGTNNIWTNSSIRELIYFASENVDKKILLTKLLLAPVLSSMVADTNLNINDFRIVNNTLYIVTASIASGGTLTPDTNVTATTICEQITNLLNA